MDLIAELENLVADWARTDQAGGGCPGCQNRRAQVSELLSAIKQEPGPEPGLRWWEPEVKDG